MGASMKLLVVLAQLVHFSFPSPITITSIAPADTAALSSRAEWRSDDLNNQYKGIWWNHLLEDTDDGCTAEQIDKIVYATRYALFMTELPRNDGLFQYSAAWDRYFRSYEDWITSDQNRIVSSTIMHNIMQASRYPKDGNKNPTLFKRVHYTCNPRTHGPAKQSCDRGNSAAVTVDPLASEFETWVIVFCPVFFTSSNLEYLQRREEGTKYKKSSIGTLMTYEHVIAHEFMHVRMFGYRHKITDLTAQIEDGGAEVPVYGEDRCHDLTSRGKPDWRPAHNADSYAWFFSYYWFDKKWNWSTPKHDELKKEGPTPQPESDDEEFEKPDIVFPDPSFPVKSEDLHYDTSENPACRTLPATEESHGHPIVYCEYVDEEYSVWIEELKRPFKSSGGCELSPACHQSGPDIFFVHPDFHCKCYGNDTSLADSRCSGFAGVALDGLVTPPPPVPKPKCSWWDFICLLIGP